MVGLTVQGFSVALGGVAQRSTDLDACTTLQFWTAPHTFQAPEPECYGPASLDSCDRKPQMTEPVCIRPKWFGRKFGSAGLDMTHPSI